MQILPARVHGHSINTLAISLSTVVLNPNQKHLGCKKSCGQELKKGQVEKDVKSKKWAAKGSAVMVLMEIKF